MQPPCVWMTTRIYSSMANDGEARRLADRPIAESGWRMVNRASRIVECDLQIAICLLRHLHCTWSSQIIYSMRNLEFKAHCNDLARAEQIAQSFGATFGGDLQQLDTYFVAPSGRLKLREINHAQGELIFYQRPEDDATRWSDYFVAAVADSAAIRDVLTRALGVRVQVAKSRRLYLYRGARIHLDHVIGLGEFIEFEVPVTPSPIPLARILSLSKDVRAVREARGEGEGRGEGDAHALMRELMDTFGLREADAIHASYSELLETT